jgi:DNA-binding FadR family transcriptional regulator
MATKPKTVSGTSSKGPNLTFSIVEDLGANIVTGKYTDKKSFPIEAELCVRYGASRSVVREAVKMLTAKGLLASRPRHGTWVQPEEEWNLFDPDILGWILDHKRSAGLRLEFGEVQLAVECTAAAFAAVRGSFSDKSAIERALVRMRAALLGEGDPLKACIAFHVAVLQASGNRFLLQFRNLIATTLQIVGPSAKGILDVEGHRKVCHAIVAADADAAYRHTRALIASIYGTNVPQSRRRVQKG